MKRKGIIALDVDGTLWCGNPKGLITARMLRVLKNELRGWRIGVLSRKVWNAKVRSILVEFDFDFLWCEYHVDDPISLHPRLIAYRKAEALRYRLAKSYKKKIYVGDRASDKKAAELAGWQFIHVDEFVEMLKKGSKGLKEHF